MTRPIAKGYIARRREILRLHNEGMMPTQIGATMGISRQAVYGILWRAGVTIDVKPQPRPKMTRKVPLLSKEERDAIEGSRKLLEALDRYWVYQEQREAA